MSGFEKLWKARSLVLGACCTATLGCLAGSAYAIPTQYEIVDLGADFYPLGINNLGTVIGVQRERFGDPFSEVGFTWMKGVGFTPIPALPGDATAVPMGINNSGLVVGASFPAQNYGYPHQPFIWSKSGGTQVLPKLVPGGLFGNVATDINDHNEVVAYGAEVQDSTHDGFVKGYVWSKARGIVRTSTDQEQGALNLDFPARLNVKGDVIGSRCYVRCEINYPFIGVDNVGSALRTNVNNDPGLKDLQPSSVRRPYLIEINDNGLGVGVAYDPNDTSDAIAVTRDGKVIELEQLITGIPAPYRYSGAFAVNNAGTILGLAFHIDDMATHIVFLTDGEEVVDLQSLVLGPAGWTGDIRQAPTVNPWRYTAGINDRGEVILTAGGHGLLLIPVPESETFVGVFAGLATLVFALTRRRLRDCSGDRDLTAE